MIKHILMVLATIYAIGCALPASIWFKPGVPVFADVRQGGLPALTYSRAINIDTHIQYTTILREEGNPIPVCEENGGPFQYLQSYGSVAGKDLGWWMSGNDKCVRELEPGIYVITTTWTVVQPMADLLPDCLDPYLGWVLPPKTITHESPPFMVYE